MPNTNRHLVSLLRDRGERLISEGRTPYGRNHLKTADSLEGYILLQHLEEAPFTAETVEGYYSYLTTRRNLQRDSASFFLRILRSAWKEAGGDVSFFEGVYTGVGRRQREALDPSVLSRLNSLRLKGASALFRDVFLFCFAAQGMEFPDLCYLRDEDISKDMITYVRRRTGMTVSVPISPLLRDILDRVSSYCLQRTNRYHISSYIFPFMARKGSAERQSHDLENARRKYNYHLKKLGRAVGCPGLSPSSPSELWAAVARSEGVSLDVIARSMGYASVGSAERFLSCIVDKEKDKYEKESERLFRASAAVLSKAGLG